jgi:hypothetical protein
MGSIGQILKSKNVTEFVKLLTFFAIVILVSTLLTQFFWNNALVRHISILRPVSGFKDALFLVIGLNILKSSCQCVA